MMDIQKLEQLSCLSLEEQERESLSRDLQEMLAFVERLAVDSSEDSTIGEGTGESVLREDIPEESVDRETLLSATAVRDGAYIAVPCVLGGETL